MDIVYRSISFRQCQVIYQAYFHRSQEMFVIYFRSLAGYSSLSLFLFFSSKEQFSNITHCTYFNCYAGNSILESISTVAINDPSISALSSDKEFFHLVTTHSNSRYRYNLELGYLYDLLRNAVQRIEGYYTRK